MLAELGDGTGLLLVVAHPDDESIAAGGHLPLWPGARVLTITDGSPLNLRDASAAGCPTRVGYAALRRSEQCTALSLAGIPPAHRTWFDFVDQQAALNLVPLAKMIAEAIHRWGVHTVLTHPFEGGHPDHDAAAFATRAAVHSLSGRKPEIFEFACYHAQAGQLRPQHFLGEPGFLIELTQTQQQWKRAMFDAHRSQTPMLSNFSCMFERFRRAPEYDFERPPAECWYGQFDWGITRAGWLALARDAWAELFASSVPRV